MEYHAHGGGGVAGDGGAQSSPFSRTPPPPRVGPMTGAPNRLAAGEHMYTSKLWPQHTNPIEVYVMGIFLSRSGRFAARFLSQGWSLDCHFMKDSVTGAPFPDPPPPPPPRRESSADCGRGRLREVLTQPNPTQPNPTQPNPTQPLQTFFSPSQTPCRGHREKAGGCPTAYFRRRCIPGVCRLIACGAQRPCVRLHVQHTCRSYTIDSRCRWEGAPTLDVTCQCSSQT